MRKNWIHATLAAVLCGLGLASAAVAGDHGAGACPSAACPADCAPACPTDCGKKVCVPTPGVRKFEKREYTDKYEDFCLPCSCWGMLTHHCDCSKVHKRKLLVVKIKKCEEPTTKCVVAIQEHCGSPCSSCGGCATGVHHDGPAPVAL